MLPGEGQNRGQQTPQARQVVRCKIPRAAQNQVRPTAPHGYEQLRPDGQDSSSIENHPAQSGADLAGMAQEPEGAKLHLLDECAPLGQVQHGEPSAGANPPLLLKVLDRHAPQPHQEGPREIAANENES